MIYQRLIRAIQTFLPIEFLIVIGLIELLWVVWALERLEVALRLHLIK